MAVGSLVAVAEPAAAAAAGYRLAAAAACERLTLRTRPTRTSLDVFSRYALRVLRSVRGPPFTTCALPNSQLALRRSSRNFRRHYPARKIIHRPAKRLVLDGVLLGTSLGFY